MKDIFEELIKFNKRVITTRYCLGEKLSRKYEEERRREKERGLSLFELMLTSTRIVKVDIIDRAKELGMDTSY